jgi:AhpD family alkylhydroperoxidase
MSKRKTLPEADPKAYRTMQAFEKYLAESSLDKIHAELIKIRVSQINGCAFCLNMHTADARKLGETELRIYLLDAWREATFYSKEERAILALAEEMTVLSKHGIADAVYDHALEVLGQQYLTEVIMAIVTMNSWNRIGIVTGLHAE